MRAHLAYLRYVVRHKWFVFMECCRLGIPWLGIIHDWNKFLPSQWFAYVNYFFGPREGERAPVEQAFDVAWLHHQKRNKHHWQYWVLIQDEDGDKVLKMPSKYAREMLADWRGAGRAQGKPNTRAWYLEHRSKMQLHPDVRAWIERELRVS